MKLKKKQIQKVTSLLDIGAKLRAALDIIETNIEAEIKGEIGDFGEVWYNTIEGGLEAAVTEIESQATPI